MVDSLEITSKTPGLLGPQQLDWLTRELDARPDKPAIVVVHHNPQFPVVTTGLLDTSALMEVLMPRRQVKAVVYGHTHDWHIVQHESGIHLVNLPPTCYPFKELRPAGWVRCALEPDGAVFELRSLDKKHPEHAQPQTLKWRAA
jgi:Icc protein